MKFFDHPVHAMIIHFPTALLPMDLVLSYLAYFYKQESFTNAAFYCLLGGVVSGYLALLTGLLDLVYIPKKKKAAIGSGLMHGFINGTVVLIYSIFLYKVWQSYPDLQAPSVILLSIKSILIITLIIGNHLGGSLIYKHHIGIHIELQS